MGHVVWLAPVNERLILCQKEAANYHVEARTYSRAQTRLVEEEIAAPDQHLMLAAFQSIGIGFWV